MSIRDKQTKTQNSNLYIRCREKPHSLIPPSNFPRCTFYQDDLPLNCAHFQWVNKNENERRNKAIRNTVKMFRRSRSSISSGSKMFKNIVPSVYNFPPISIESQLIFSIILQLPGCSDMPYHYHSMEGTGCIHNVSDVHNYMYTQCMRS